MIRDTKRLSQNPYDLLVIGGGINGAALSYLAAARGLKVALLEKGDFASGTSSKSTKLIHGGLRYLEHLEFGLVREGLKERYIQMKNAPHLVKRLSFVIPVYRHDPRPLWMMKLGVGLYGFLSGKYKINGHKNLTANELARLEPGIAKADLLGGVMYDDAQMDDSRLCLENVLSACQKGAHAANYVEVKEFLKDRGTVVGVNAFDLLEKKTLLIQARKIVCATGPWTNELLRMDDKTAHPLVRLTKGVHLVYPGGISRHALLLTTQRDRRIFFVIPWMGNSLIGTTDTDFRGDPDQVEASPEDIEYLLNEAQRFFPSLEFKKEKIITTVAGLRPLLARKGPPQAVSRQHRIVQAQSGLFFVIGGKYTTYRVIARDCLKKVFGKRKGPPAKNRGGGPLLSQTDEDYPLYGSGPLIQTPAAAARQFDVSRETVEHLMGKYGTRYEDVLRLTLENPELKKPLCTCSPAIAAQVVYSIQVEMARRPEDIILRRLGIGYLGCGTKTCERMIERFMG